MESSSEGRFLRTVPIDDVPPASARPVELEGASLLICNYDGAFFAIVNECTHANEKLECGRIRNGFIACPAHGARFDLATGEALTGPAVDPVQTFSTRIVDGWIEVAI